MEKRKVGMTKVDMTNVDMTSADMATTASCRNESSSSDGGDKSAQSVVYRPVTWNDVDTIVVEYEHMWGTTDLGDDIADSMALSRHCTFHYLEPATYGEIAECDGEFMGVIIIRVVDEPVLFPQAQEELSRFNASIRDSNSKTANRRLDEALHWHVVEDVMEEDAGVNKTTQGEVELFLVSAKARGHGVGGTLWRHAMEHFAHGGAQRFYLHTDSSCDFSFYDHKGMTCVSKRIASEHPEDTKIRDDIYIYAKDVPQPVAR